MKLENLRIVSISARLIIIIVFMLEQAGCSKATQPALNPVSGDENVVITFTSNVSNYSFYESMIKAFHKQNPSITVQFVAQDPNGGGSLEQMAAQADTIRLGSAISPSASQLFLDLSPLMTNASFNPSHYWPGAMQGCQAGELQKGLPVNLGPNLILYNQTAFDQAKLAYPKPGWTWDDFRAAVQALSDPPAKRYGFQDSQTRSLMSPLIDATLTNGGDRASLASALQWYVDLARDGRIIASDATQQKEQDMLIRNGQVAMWLGTLSSLSFDWQGLDFPVGVAPFPGDSKNQATTPIIVSCAVISAGTQYPAASWAWLAFLSQNMPPEDGSFFAPAWMTTAQSSGYWQQLKPETTESVRFALQHGWYSWVKSDFASIKAILETAIQTGSNLASLLPEDLTRLQEEAVVPTSNSTPVAVSGPTSTPAPAVKPSNAASAVYFVDPEYHTSVSAVKDLADAFNRSHPEMYIEIAEERPDFNSGYYDMYDVSHFDCFAASSGSILPRSDPNEDVDFAGKVYTLDSLLDSASMSLLDDLTPALVKASRIDGALYGLPVALRPLIVYTNATLLKDLGLKPPALDWTVTDFWNLAAAAAAEKDGVYGYVPTAMDPYLLLSNASYMTMSPDGLVASYADPSLVGMLNQLVPLVKGRALFLTDSGGTRSPLGNQQDRDEQLAKGNAAMWINNAGMTYGLNTESYQPPHGFEAGVAVLPIDQSISTAGSLSLYISKQAKNPQVCWAWFEYLEEQPQNIFKGIPARRSILDSDTWAASVGQERAEVYRATVARLQDSAGPLNDLYYQPVYEPFGQWWSDAVVAVLQDGKDAGMVLNGIQYKAQATLDCMQAAGVNATTPTDRVANTAISCANKVDPSYHTLQELFKLQASP